MVPGTPYDSARVDALLTERGAAARPDGVRVWRLKHGDVEVGELREGGQLVATELRVPLSDKMDLVREVVEEGATLAPGRRAAPGGSPAGAAADAPMTAARWPTSSCARRATQAR